MFYIIIVHISFIYLYNLFSILFKIFENISDRLFLTITKFLKLVVILVINTGIILAGWVMLQEYRLKAKAMK